MPDNKNQRTVVVTGGARGIGRAVCLAFAAPDVHIFFNYTQSGDAARATEEKILEKGATCTSMALNIADFEDVSKFFNRIIEETGRVDVLVNNAGITKDGLIARMKIEDWDNVIDVNLKGVFNCIKCATKPMMKQHNGRIINMTSVVGAMGNPGQANYVASKAGIIGLTKSVALELASRNITVNAVAPGIIETDMTASLPEKTREILISQVPLKRVGRPEDIADAVVFLASEKAAYITGQVIHVSGGMYM